jgi:hypothetical protein
MMAGGWLPVTASGPWSRRCAVLSAGRQADEPQLAVNVGACALLLIQYLLDMAVNVYVVLPSRHPRCWCR